MTAYYNEHDKKAAAWLRELIKQGYIAFGDVDERSITDVHPSDLRGYSQCHFFAGIGVWSYALRRAGWPDSRSVWTGSCPCQPFSAAGKGDEFADERHLWPAWFRLIRECCPVAIFGEQVASKDALAWLDHVSTDLEGEGYAVGAVDTCAAGFGAPHIRQRLYFVADSHHAERRPQRGACDGLDERHSGLSQREEGTSRSECGGAFNELGDPARGGFRINGGAPGYAGHSDQSEQIEFMADTDGRDAGAKREQCSGEQRFFPEGGECGAMGHTSGARPQTREPEILCGTGRRDEGRAIMQPGPTNGFWSNAEWIACRDGKARPIESLASPMASGLTDSLGLVRLSSYPDHQNASEEAFVFAPLVANGKNRVMRLRGYGNAICAEQAKAFIEVAMECLA